MDLPVIVDATAEYYRNIFADSLLGPLFKAMGVNMVVLRQHVSYFLHQLTTFDAPMTERQLEYLRKVHTPIIEQRGATQEHYDRMIGYLLDAMRCEGAAEANLRMVMTKLQPLRDLFPPPGQPRCAYKPPSRQASGRRSTDSAVAAAVGNGSSADGHVDVRETGGGARAGAAAADARGARDGGGGKSKSKQPPAPVAVAARLRDDSAPSSPAGRRVSNEATPRNSNEAPRRRSSGDGHHRVNGVAGSGGGAQPSKEPALNGAPAAAPAAPAAVQQQQQQQKPAKPSWLSCLSCFQAA